MKDTKLEIRISKDEKARLTALAEKRDAPVSQIVREAIREKIADSASVKPENAELVLAE